MQQFHTEPQFLCTNLSQYDTFQPQEWCIIECNYFVLHLSPFLLCSCNHALQDVTWVFCLYVTSEQFMICDVMHAWSCPSALYMCICNVFFKSFRIIPTGTVLVNYRDFKQSITIRNRAGRRPINLFREVQFVILICGFVGAGCSNSCVWSPKL